MKIYGIGLGPGDPELLTLKAVRIMNEVDVVIVPQSDKTGKSMAQGIIKGHIAEEKMLFYYFPMTNDVKELDLRYTDVAEKVLGLLQDGKTVAYVTIGDTPVYSTFNYLYAKLKCLDIEVEMVPGISSFSAIANRASLPLCEKYGNFCVIEMPDDLDILKDKVANFETVIVMKVHKRFEKLVSFVKEAELAEAVMIQRVSLPDEQIYDLKEIGSNNFQSKEKAGYMSTAILKK